MTRRLAACALAAAALLVAGCRDTADSTSTGGDTLTVYSILPMEGPTALAARDIVDGEKLALREAHGQVGPLTINFRAVNSAEDKRVTEGSAAAAARKGAQDPSAIAAIGALSAVEARVEIPILNEASVGLLTPAVTELDLTEPRLYPSGPRTFSRVIGDDAEQARVVRALAEQRACRRLVTLEGPDTGERMLAEQVGGARLPLARATEVPRGACVFLASSAPKAAARAARALGARQVFAPAALATEAFARRLGPAERSVTLLVPLPQAGARVADAFARTFGRRPRREGLLGYDAMRAVLQAVREAGNRGNDRAAVARRLLRANSDGWGTSRVRGGRLLPAVDRAPTF